MMDTFFLALGATGILMIGCALVVFAGWGLLHELREWRDKRDCQLVYKTEQLHTKQLGEQIEANAYWFTPCNDGYAVAVAIGRALRLGAGSFNAQFARDDVLRSVVAELKEKEGK